MPLLKPPEAVIPQRRCYLRMEESLAQTTERYAEFQGSGSIDHAVAQALQFIFKQRFGERYPNTTQVLRSLASTMGMSESSRTENSSPNTPREIP